MEKEEIIFVALEFASSIEGVPVLYGMDKIIEFTNKIIKLSNKDKL